MTLLLLSTVLAVSSRRRVLALGLVIPAITAKWVSDWRPDLLFVFFVVVHLFSFIFRAPRIDSEVLCASVAAYLLLGLLWAFAYLLVYRLVPDAIPLPSWTYLPMNDALYFLHLPLIGYALWRKIIFHTGMDSRNAEPCGKGRGRISPWTWKNSGSG